MGEKYVFLGVSIVILHEGVVSIVILHEGDVGSFLVFNLKSFCSIRLSLESHYYRSLV